MEIERTKARPDLDPEFNAECGDIILRLVANFPALLLDDDEVSGADVVEWISNELFNLKERHSVLLLDRATFGTPDPWIDPLKEFP